MDSQLLTMNRRRAAALRCSRALSSLPALFILFALAVLMMVTEKYVEGTLLFAGMILVELFLVSDLTVPAAPLLFLSVFVLNLYDCYDTFIKFVWVIPIVVIAILYNLIAFRAPIKTGRTLIGLIAVAIALPLGGFGYITFERWRAPTSLFYIFGLGLGMVGVYLLLRARFGAMNIYGIFGRIARIMYLVGILAIINTALFYWRNIGDEEITGELLSSVSQLYQPSNNISTFLMFAMPYPVWFALKQNPLHIFATIGFYFGIVISGSRAGLVLGGIELVLCLIVWSRYSGKVARIVSAILVIAGVVLAFAGIAAYSSFGKFHYVNKGEFRWEAIGISVDCLNDHPIFGVGMNHTELEGLYAPKEGAIAWFHMYIPQIIATMGWVGIVAYGLQLILRASLMFRRKCGPLRLVLAVSYIGVLLMSQLNPGEFCPVPYGMMAVAIFVLLEQLGDVEREARRLAPEWRDSHS